MVTSMEYIANLFRELDIRKAQQAERRKSELLCLPASQIVTQVSTGSPVRRYGRLIVVAMEEVTFATATH